MSSHDSPGTLEVPTPICDGRTDGYAMTSSTALAHTVRGKIIQEIFAPVLDFLDVFIPTVGPMGWHGIDRQTDDKQTDDGVQSEMGRSVINGYRVTP